MTKRLTDNQLSHLIIDWKNSSHYSSIIWLCRKAIAADRALRATPAPAQPEGQEDGPVTWLKDDGSEAWTNNKKRATVETMGAGGAMMAARFSRPLVEAGAAAPAEGAAWQPIETAPKGESVLVYMPQLEAVEMSHQTEDGRWIGNSGLKWPPGVLSHWMPLPAAPKEKP